MTNLLADESVDFRIVKALRSNGYQIETILEISPGISDDQVLKIANEKSAVIITSDKDFGELTFRQKKSNFGIILLRFPNEVIEEQMEVTQLAFEKFGVELPYKFTVVTSKKILESENYLIERRSFQNRTPPVRNRTEPESNILLNN